MDHPLLIIHRVVSIPAIIQGQGIPMSYKSIPAVWFPILQMEIMEEHLLLMI
jgi:hypothetical protein